MTVKPAAVIAYVRREILVRRLIPYEIFLRFDELFRRFQRVRWVRSAMLLEETGSGALQDQMGGIAPDAGWVVAWESFSGVSRLLNPSLEEAVKEAETKSCFTCSGCSGSCPVFYERSVFLTHNGSFEWPVSGF
jgi:Fe-S oxidoreductase